MAMQGTEIITLNQVLSYIYGRLLITFLFCLIGIIAREYIAHTRSQQYKSISIIGVLIRGIIASIIVSFIVEFVTLPIAGYVLLSVLSGLWNDTILNIITSNKFINAILKGAVKTFFKGQIEELVEEALDEIQEEETKDETTDNQDEEKENKEDPDT